MIFGKERRQDPLRPARAWKLVCGKEEGLVLLVRSQSQDCVRPRRGLHGLGDKAGTLYLSDRLVPAR